MSYLLAGCGWFHNSDGYWCQGSWNGDQFNQQCVLCIALTQHTANVADHLCSVKCDWVPPKPLCILHLTYGALWQWHNDTKSALYILPLARHSKSLSRHSLGAGSLVKFQRRLGMRHLQPASP